VLYSFMWILQAHSIKSSTRVVYLIILIGCCSSLSAQSQQITFDSLENLIRRLPNDTSKVNRLNEFAAKVSFTNAFKAIDAAKQAIVLSKKIKYPLGLSVAYGLRANLLFYSMDIDSAKFFTDKGYALVSNSKDRLSKIQAALHINRYASIYQQRQKYDSAIQRYLESAAIFSELNDEAKIIISYYNISGIYNFLEDSSKAIYYARQTRKIALKTKNSMHILRSHMALADAFVTLGQYDSLLVQSKIGLLQATQQNLAFAKGKFHSLLGTYCTKKTKQYDSAIAHFKVALNELNQINVGYDVALVLNNIGHTYLQMKDYPNAIAYLKQAETQSRKLKLDQILRVSLMDISATEENRGNIKEGFYYLKEYIKVNDSVQLRNNRKIVSDLEIKYQTAKKEALLQLQQKTILQKNTLNYVLVAIVLCILVISYFAYTTYRQKQLLAEQEIEQLQNEKLLLASESILKGQEDERTRMAQDLHDGLGGMLSGVKLTLGAMKGNIILTEENAQLFTKAFDQLDKSIGEMRRVAHNMMPESLVKFGLQQALQDYCESINVSKQLSVKTQFLGLENRVDGSTEIIVYRIIQELTNNSIKHSNATNLMVQVMKNRNELSITVEDDGRGFDQEEGNTKKGAGLSNIRSRVDYLKGQMDIKSAPGAGTSVHIECPV
jgi:two-component system, NarL family, sensor kinase